MPDEVLICMSEGLFTRNYMIGDSTGIQVGRVEYSILGNRTANISYLNDARYSFRHLFSIVTDHFDLIDDRKLQAGSSEKESTVALAVRFWETTCRFRCEIAGESPKLCLVEDGFVSLLGKYEAQFRILLFDGTDKEGQCLGMISSIKALSRDFNLTFSSAVPIPIRLFCFALVMDRLHGHGDQTNA